MAIETLQGVDKKRAVQPGRHVYFEYYCDGEFWYSTEFGEGFPVPISDIGNATLKSVDKAILFMRYMRLWNEKLEKSVDSTNKNVDNETND